ncbi:MAG: hypothetical protein FWF43_05690 [Propionibacteriaceae bacterium]|nr:hypothetical protein [Propionibacteriaceae bacterium]
MSGVAKLSGGAVLRPTKLELMAAWMPRQPWCCSAVDDLELLGSYRLVDPDGEVGIEGMIVKGGGVVYHVPLTYRSQELAGAEDWLLGTMDHSVLGQRWVYDGLGDPVCVLELTRVICEADRQSDTSVPQHKPASAQGSGVPAGVHSEDLTVGVVRTPEQGDDAPTAVVGTLSAQWPDGDSQHTGVVAYVIRQQ